MSAIGPLVLLVSAISVLQGAPAPAPAPTPAPTPPPIARKLPAVSFDGSRIVYLAEEGGVTDVYTVAATGGTPTRVTSTTEAEERPEWTRDGRIVFALTEGETSRLVSVAAGGGDRKEVAAAPGRTPRLSPDGQSLLYWRGTWMAVELLVQPRAGGAPRRLTDGSSAAWGPLWSPDGRWVVFTGHDAARNLQLFVVAADGKSAPRQVTRFSAAEGRAQLASWSPDGRRLALMLEDAENRSHIWIAEVETGAAVRVGESHGDFLDEAPRWFPDGKRLAFQSDRTGRMEIWTVAVDGSDLRQVTR